MAHEKCAEVCSCTAATHESRTLWQIVGPGILFAAVAVGVSHLVQATRAGANYGLALAILVVVACLLKYPTLRFGGVYSAATGETLIASYRRQGIGVFLVYAVAQIFSMIFVTAALSLFTTGLVQATFGIKLNNILAVGLLQFFVIVMLVTGKYRALEKLSKAIVAMFTVLIIASTLLVLPKLEWTFSSFAMPQITVGLIPFLLALMGFMPTPAEGSVLQSLWTCARARDCGRNASQREAAIDFNFGFGITIVLALCFLVMGAGVMHSAGVQVVKSNFGFSKQLMELFTKTLGDWSFPLIAIAAISVMFSTMYTVVDGYTRIVMEFVKIHKGCSDAPVAQGDQKLYLLISSGLSVGALIILATMMKSFATFMDMVSIIVFVTSPLIAILNHRAVFGPDMPMAARPGLALRVWSYVGIAFFTIVTLVYVYTRFVS